MTNDVPYTPRFLSLSGRIGRLRYLAYCFAIALLGYAVMMLGTLLSLTLFGEDAGMVITITLAVVLYIALIVYTFGYMVRRLHDLNHSGWFCLLTLVPIVNLILVLYLLFARGQPASNRFGPRPAANTTGVVILAVMMPVLLTAIIGILAAIAIPQYAEYVERAQAMQSAP
ncbi:DUF805 domain-containing protein [Alcanivorax sp. JB21]|nr:DUF805 domain-containing protein [Alcanivorax limicola]